MGNDTIYKQDAIDAINTWDKFGIDERSRVVRWHEGLEPYVKLRNVVWAIENLPSVQPELQWHKCDPDDPSSFPDDDRPVLVSFPDSPIPAVGWFERHYDFYGWTDGELFGLHADGWWELPKKPERRTDGSD